jgi:hypothetical protein
VGQRPGRPDEVEAALLRRAAEAIDAAERIRARSEVLAGLSFSLRARMVTRCAWCGRYRIDGDYWVVVEQPPGGWDVTHGICDDCFAALLAAGMSV